MNLIELHTIHDIFLLMFNTMILFPQLQHGVYTIAAFLLVDILTVIITETRWLGNERKNGRFQGHCFPNERELSC